MTHRQPKTEPSVSKPADGREGHERRFDFGHIPEFQREYGDDGDGQLPVGVHNAQLLESARRSSRQRGRFAGVEPGTFARWQGIANAISLFQRDPSEFFDRNGKKKNKTKR